MIEERARVVSVSGDGEMAEVETQRVTACGTCSSKVGCGSALLAGLFGKRRSRLQALNRIRARPGDGVVIGFPEGLFLRAAFALYAVPLLGMIGAAVTVLCVFAGIASNVDFFRVYLQAFIFVFGLAGGSLILLMIHHVAGGRWGFITRGIMEAGAKTIPLCALLFVPLGALLAVKEVAAGFGVQIGAVLVASLLGLALYRYRSALGSA